jgi:hypothetical protein
MSFVYDQLKNSQKYKTGIPEKTDKHFFQFIPALVKRIVINKDSRDYSEARDINSVIASPYIGGITSDSGLGRQRAYPLLRGISDVPNIDDMVLITQINEEFYYLGPINVLNNPNVTTEELKLNTKFPLAPSARLQKFSKMNLDASTEKDNRTHGDMVFEGRFGSSIRLGSRANSPLILISNGRDIGIPIESAVDGSLISIISKGAIYDNLSPFTLGSDSVIDGKRMVAGGNDSPETDKFDYEYGNSDGQPTIKHQIYIASDRIIFNARENNLTLSAFNNIDFGAGNNITINTNKFVSIESSNIYLGKQAQEEAEPLVLGEQLRLILEEIVNILEVFKVSGTVGGISGPPAPDVISKIINLKNKLSSPAFFSEYHYIEENGQKA